MQRARSGNPGRPLFAAIAEQQKIDVSDAEVEAKLKEIADQ